MKPCAVCNRIVIGDVIGVQWGMTGNLIVACVHNCVCGTTRYEPWADVPQEVRAEALLAERARMAIEGAV